MRNMRIDSESPITEGFSVRLAQSSSQQINVDCEELPEYSAVVMRDDMEAIEEWSHEANSHGNSEECEGFDRESLLSHIVNSDPPEETVPGYSINDTFPDVNTNSSLIGMSQMEHQTLQHASMCGELENFEIPTSAEVKSSAPAYSIPVSPPMYLPPMFAEEPKSEPQDGPVLVFHSAEFSSFSAMAFALSDFKLQQEYLWSSRRAPSGTHSFVESSGTTDAITAIYESVDSEKREDEYPQFLFGHDFHDHHKLPHASSFDCAESNTSGCRFFEDWGSSRGAGENGCFREWETGSLETGIANCNWHIECPPYVGNVSDSRHVKQDRIHDTCGDLVEFEKYFYLDDESKSSRCGSKNGSILFGLGEEFDLCQGGTVVGGDDPPAYHNNTWAKGNNMDIV
ncbi:hypothetical protein HDU82_002007 [Entophlyctis luteolus]|nr:hypothetical protein HDU82_002007 [Entophlyctis luteolus]